MESADQIISSLDLTPHPSGCSGWFRQTFASSTLVQTPSGERTASTAVYFLQKFGQKSAFHRQRSAEVFHFYQGVALTLYWIDPEGGMNKTVLGLNLGKGELPQVRTTNTLNMHLLCNSRQLFPESAGLLKGLRAGWKVTSAWPGWPCLRGGT